jgi:hypothetical protein
MSVTCIGERRAREAFVRRSCVISFSIDPLASESSRSSTVVGIEFAIDDHLTQPIFDLGNPPPRGSVEHGHQVMAVEWALELIERLFGLEPGEVVAKTLDTLGRRPPAMSAGAGDVRGGEINQILEGITGFQRETPHSRVGPVRFIR